MWQYLKIYPKGSIPYLYTVRSLSYKPGILFKIINYWCDRGIDLEITLTKL